MLACAPPPQNEGDDGKAHGHDGPAAHARQEGEGDALVPGPVEPQMRDDLDKLLEGEVLLDEILDPLVEQQRDEDEGHGNG